MVHMENIKKKKLYLQVYIELKNYIVDNNLKPGDRLPTEMEMSSNLGVSRNVLREAIKTLEILGVVTSKQRVGIVVNKFDPATLSNCLFLNLLGGGENIVEQSLEIRKILELGFCEQAFFSMDNTLLAKLEKIVVEMSNLDNKPGRFYDLDTKFHCLLYANIKNDILIAYIRSAWECEKHYRYLFKEDFGPMDEKHTNIVKALKAKDLNRFKQSMIDHFSTFKHKA